MDSFLVLWLRCLTRIVVPVSAIVGSFGFGYLAVRYRRGDRSSCGRPSTSP
jgi:hypothetical protein